MSAARRVEFSTEKSSTVDDQKALVPPPVLARVLRAMDFRCLECRGGERKNIAGHAVRCTTCDGFGTLNAYTISTLAAASGLTLARTYDATRETLSRNLTAEHVVDGVLYLTLTEQGEAARKRCR